MFTQMSPILNINWNVVRSSERTFTYTKYCHLIFLNLIETAHGKYFIFPNKKWFYRKYLWLAEGSYNACIMPLGEHANFLWSELLLLSNHRIWMDSFFPLNQLHVDKYWNVEYRTMNIVWEWRRSDGSPWVSHSLIV